MDRRDVLRWFGSAGVAGVLPSLSPVTVQGQVSVPYTVQGSGPVLMAFDRGAGQYDGFTDRYRVVILDYPPAALRDATSTTVIESFTPDRVCADILAVADEVEADRFAWYGYSWGGVVGLQLAIRTNRLTALVCAGWPPLGAPYKDMAKVGRTQPIITNFYRHLEHWPEREAVAGITCPRLTFAGREDVIVTPDVTARIGPLIAEHREELERMGWTVRLVDGATHDIGFQPAVVVPLVRQFLDPLLLRR
jgi:pimeloyl-ACP methyl ester carboxylesterase